MSKSLLSGALSGSSESEKKKNKKNGAVLLIAGLALASSIGGVFAANNSITINEGAAIEFGQGVAATTSCTEALETSISQQYVSGEDFKVNEVVVSSIDVARCDEVDLRVALVDESNTELTFTTIRGDAESQTWSIGSVQTVSADAVRRVVVTTAD